MFKKICTATNRTNFLVQKSKPAFFNKKKYVRLSDAGVKSKSFNFVFFLMKLKQT